MESKLDTYETIVNEQRKKLNDKDTDIQDLERTVINQDKEIARIKDEIIRMKGNMFSEDFQINVQEKTNRSEYDKYQERNQRTIGPINAHLIS